MINKKGISLHPQSSNNDGAIAQLVEQRTENPCVPGSIPGGTTLNKQNPDFETKSGFFVFIKHTKSSNNKYINPCPAMNIYNERPTKYIAQTTDTSHILHNEIIKIIVLCGQ